METIETRNGWTITGTVTDETDAQIMIRPKSVHHNGLDCTNVSRPNMIIAKDNVKTRA